MFLPMSLGFARLNWDDEYKSVLETVNCSSKVCIIDTAVFQILNSENTFSPSILEIFFYNICVKISPTLENYTSSLLYELEKKAQHISFTPQISQMENCHFASQFSMLNWLKIYGKWLIYVFKNFKTLFLF